MRIYQKYFILILLTSGLFGEILPSNAEVLFEQARTAESGGDLSRAEKLYDSLYSAFPRNVRYLSRYKSVLIRAGHLDKAAEITQALYRLNRENINYLAELGVLMIANGHTVEAFRLWDPYLHRQSQKTRLPQLSIMYLTAYNNGSGLPEMISCFRKKTGDPLLQSQTYFTDLIRRQMWQPALDEFLLHKEKSPGTLPVLIRELKTLKADAPLYSMILDTLQRSASGTEDFRLMADLAFSSEHYPRTVKILMNNTPPLKNEEILKTARNLFEVSQHQLSLALLKHVETFIRSQPEREEMLYLRALNYNALSHRDPSFDLKLTPPYHSIFLSLPVRPAYTLNRTYADSAISLFNVLSTETVRRDIRYEARTKLADMHLYITGDLDKAAALLTDIPRSLPDNIRNTLLSQYITCRILQNDEKSARRKILEAPSDYRLNAQEEDRLRLNLIFIDLAFNRQDSLEKHVNEALALIHSRDPVSNDVLALASYLQISAEEPRMIELESHIRKREWNRSIETATQLMKQKAPVQTLAALRLEQILFQTGRQNKLEIFWNQYGRVLKQDAVLGDFFTLRHVAFYEFTGKPDSTQKILQDFLTTWPESLYGNSVREYIRR